jgi:glycosyltransferase involved in cell wall biosynthesis
MVPKANLSATGFEYPTPARDDSFVEASVVMPCLNEAETLETCIRKAQRALCDQNILGEIIVADNGSADGSQAIAARKGARVIHVQGKGYGNALMGGIAAARGKFIIMGDADDSYDFTAIGPFVEKLREGYDLVMGNRFKGGIKPGAMPFLHRYLGNPVLSGIGRLFFSKPCGDFHCGLRGLRKDAVLKLDLQTTGMEFASEMVVKAALFGMRIGEVPTVLWPDGRSRPPHLRSWRDGWRHLRFLLGYSPRWLFFYPGVLFMAAGLLVGAWLLPGARTIGGVTFDVHTLLYSMALIIIGFQSVIFSLFTKTFIITVGLHPKSSRIDRWYRFFSLEKGLLTGVILTLFGLSGSIYALSNWSGHLFGSLNPVQTLRFVIPSILSLVLGFETILSSFFLSVLQMPRKEAKAPIIQAGEFVPEEIDHVRRGRHGSFDQTGDSDAPGKLDQRVNVRPSVKGKHPARPRKRARRHYGRGRSGRRRTRGGVTGLVANGRKSLRTVSLALRATSKHPDTIEIAAANGQHIVPETSNVAMSHIDDQHRK